MALLESTSPRCDPLTVQAVIWLFRAYNAALTTHADQLRPFGLSPSGFNVLMALHNSDDHTLEPCQLAERLLVSRPSITGLLDTLSTKGLIIRRPHGGDRRRVLVALTADGLALLHATFDEHYRRLNELFADLSADDRAQLVGLLRRVRGAVPAELQPVASPTPAGG
ncbi:MAG: MarR family transcriptional regulator [Actinomycetota bacterium]|nr:MarR family transcriptional regulator [Actinomycetota bacterium]